jgi:hypothetical protein
MNGEHVTCPGVNRQATLTVDNDMFYVNLFVMSVAGYDLVLGTQWLGNLRAGTLGLQRSTDVVLAPRAHRVLVERSDANRARHSDNDNQQISSGRVVGLLRGRNHRAQGATAAAHPRPQHRPQAGHAAGGSPAIPVPSYDVRILHKTHVPVSDTVSDTDTSRILPDTYRRRIGYFCRFK